MKNKKKVVSIVVVLLICITSAFFFFKGRTSEEQIKKIHLGMSVNEVQSILAYPKKSITDTLTISEMVYDDYKMMEEITSLMEFEELSYQMELLDKVYRAAQKNENVRTLIYKTSKRDVEIHFIGGAVAYVNKPYTE